ncbi:hypothetical protein [Enterococcus hailinensis]|uniref:hypothetical protein n=1 Tax=Enterococcus hailinensis TaxID=3238988 RepID=UPI0038B2E16D
MLIPSLHILKQRVGTLGVEGFILKRLNIGYLVIALSVSKRGRTIQTASADNT